MSLYDQVTSEYGQVVATKFWELYLERIKEYRAILSRACETEDSPRKSQGAISAIDFILGKNEQQPLAERLLSELKRKSK